MPQKLALLIGTDQYADSKLTNLAVPEKDVRAFESVLKDGKICAFDDVQVLMNPHLSDLRRMISERFHEKKKDDLVLLYLSGHGLRDADGELYFALKGTQLDNPLGTALDAAFIKKVMNKSRSRRQVLILDCCYSGAFTQGDKKGSALSSIDPGTFEVEGYGREILTSSGPTQLSWEGSAITGETDQSLFTHFLIEGLKTGEAAPEEDEITVEHLYLYAHKRVLEATPNMKPERSVDSGQGRFVIARNPHAVIKVDTLPGFLKKGIESDTPLMRDGSVRELERWLQSSDQAKVIAANSALKAMREKERDVYVLQAINEALGTPKKSPVEGMDESSGSTKKQKVKPKHIIGLAAVFIILATILFVVLLNQEKLRGGLRAGADGRKPGSVFRDFLSIGGKGPEMVVIPGGNFFMGDMENKGPSEERPVHQVKFLTAFAMGKYETTVGEFRAFINASNYKAEAEEGDGSFTYDDKTGKPEKKIGINWRLDYRGNPAADNLPVVHVSWNDAKAYAEWVKNITRKDYRLPSEAELEYAKRAKSKSIYPWGTGSPQAKVANIAGEFDLSSEGHFLKDNFKGYEDGFWGPAPVGSFPANAFGLHDTTGNVWEWAEDCWHETYEHAPIDGTAWGKEDDGDCSVRILRGGSWDDGPDHIRSAVRGSSKEKTRYPGFGFRLARN